MKFIRTNIPDVVICEPEILGDDRGYFIETFRKEALEKFIGSEINFCQDNESKSSYGVLRGLHYQKMPYAQTKLVRVINGEVLDVVVDIRKGSSTFGQHVSIKLTEKNKKQLFIPKGFAHGYIVLSKEAVFAYKVDAYYAPDHERGIAFDDKTLGIDWEILLDKIQLSNKDKQQSSFLESEYFDIIN